MWGRSLRPTPGAARSIAAASAATKRSAALDANAAEIAAKSPSGPRGAVGAWGPGVTVVARAARWPLSEAGVTDADQGSSSVWPIVCSVVGTGRSTAGRRLRVFDAGTRPVDPIPTSSRVEGPARIGWTVTLSETADAPVSSVWDGRAVAARGALEPLVGAVAARSGGDVSRSGPVASRTGTAASIKGCVAAKTG